jgi:hypothetical protein
MSFDPLLQTSDVLISTIIQTNLKGQNVFVQIIPTPNNDLALIIRVEAPPIPQYGNEITMYGKSLRLLHVLEKSAFLTRLLKEHNVKHVGVTESKNPALCNEKNTATFETKTLEVIFKSLPSMSTAHGEEYIGHIIKMNTTKR